VDFYGLRACHGSLRMQWVRRSGIFWIIESRELQRDDQQTDHDVILIEHERSTVGWIGRLVTM